MIDQIQLGIYYIPPTDTPLYEMATSVIGYDIRRQRPCQRSAGVQESWVGKATDYGAHVTVTDAITYDTNEAEPVASRLEELLACLHTLPALTYKGVQSWHGRYLTLALEPDSTMMVLHTLLASQLHPMGISSAYTNKPPLSLGTADKKKIELFRAPYIFDNFRPHIALLGAFDGRGQDRQELMATLTRQLPDTGTQIVINQLALVSKRPQDQHFTIWREYKLNG